MLAEPKSAELKSADWCVGMLQQVSQLLVSEWHHRVQRKSVFRSVLHKPMDTLSVAKPSMSAKHSLTFITHFPKLHLIPCCKNLWHWLIGNIITLLPCKLQPFNRVIHQRTSYHNPRLSHCTGWVLYSNPQLSQSQLIPRACFHDLILLITTHGSYRWGLDCLLVNWELCLSAQLSFHHYRLLQCPHPCRSCSSLLSIFR